MSASSGLRTFPWPGLIEAYRDRLPVTDATPVITLHEGNTPLVPAPRLSERTGCDVMLKVEGANPTGSFKDRGMTVAISKAVEAGTKVVVCASTGNTSASAAAYAARAGVLCAVLLPCLPPTRYTRGPFVEPPTIERVSLATIQQACSTGENIVLSPTSKKTPRIQQALGNFGGGLSIMGCALITNTSCIVHVPSDVEKVIPRLYDIVVEHELGHCRGWVHPRY